MSRSYVHDYEDDEQFQSTIFSHSSNGSPGTTEFGNDASIPAPSASSKKKRNLPGNPDPDAEVVALSPRTLMATNRYICEVCHKGFQRDQNLQLHRRGHNLPWKLKQRPAMQAKKRVYICPEVTCVHHDPSRALGDLTGIKKHFCRKHGEKKWKCDKCSKRYAVQSDWKAHAKICGTREYRCDCGTVFSRKDSFVTHRAFCDALTDENHKLHQNLSTSGGILPNQPQNDSSTDMTGMMNMSFSNENVEHPLPPPLTLNSSGVLIPNHLDPFNPAASRSFFSSMLGSTNPMNMVIGSGYTSATALLQKAAEMGSKISDNTIAPILLRGNSMTAPKAPFHKGGSSFNPSSYDQMLYASEPNVDMFDRKQETEYPKPNFPIPQVGMNEHGMFLQDGSGQRVLFSGQMCGEKTTVDFLGVDHVGNSRMGTKRSYDGTVMGISQPNVPHETQNLHSGW
ncbi:hypothetical protein MLD38_017093 [Melastoma candidum]|uniref:Uncharacterized protein n=1 Tax=Melastoma candidum TaxID=119954 RepID=A0ACB9QRE3_9MYRT|nr:hypothetical protein MLD38_017093 [Melastoma candidum]